MSESATSVIVQEFLDGNAAAASTICATPHEELLGSVSGQELVLTKLAVMRVLEDLRSDRIKPADVQRWASFVRRGFAAPARGPLLPLDIVYEPQFEDEIVEAIGRMDEIGDIIDGDFTADEIEEHLTRLRGARS